MWPTDYPFKPALTLNGWVWTCCGDSPGNEYYVVSPELKVCVPIWVWMCVREWLLGWLSRQGIKSGWPTVGLVSPPLKIRGLGHQMPIKTGLLVSPGTQRSVCAAGCLRKWLVHFGGRLLNSYQRVSLLLTFCYLWVLLRLYLLYLPIKY